MGLIEMQQSLIQTYESFISSFPIAYQPSITLIIYSVVVSIFLILTWHFYQNIAKKDILKINLNQYNKTTHPLGNKLLASLLYVIEFIIILPFMVIIWFTLLALMILVLSENQNTAQIVTVAAVMVASIRIAAYFREDLAQEVGKMFPLTILIIIITSPNFFSLGHMLDALSELPIFFGYVASYLAVLIILELVLQLMHLVHSLWTSESDKS